MSLDLTILEAAIVAAVPALVAWAKPYLTRLPKVAIPILAAGIGVGLQALAAYLAGPDVDPVLGAVLGLAAVGLREVVDQGRKAAN